MRTSRCSSSRARGPAIEKPASVEAAERTCTSAAAAAACQNQRRWNSSAKPEPTMRKRSSARQAIERSPTIRPAAFSIGASPSRPGFGNAAGEHAIKPGAGAAAGHLVLAVVGRLVNARRTTHRLAFRAHYREGLRAAVGRASPCAATPGGANHSACSRPKLAPITRPGLEQAGIDRRAAHGARRWQLLVRVGEAEAPRVVLRDLDRGVLGRRKGAEARDVHREDVLAGIAARPSSATAPGRCRRPG